MNAEEKHHDLTEDCTSTNSPGQVVAPAILLVGPGVVAQPVPGNRVVLLLVGK